MDEETKELLLSGFEELSNEVEQRMNEFAARLSALESQLSELLDALGRE